MISIRIDAAALASGLALLCACSGAGSDDKRSSSLDASAVDPADAGEAELDAGEAELDAGEADLPDATRGDEDGGAPTDASGADAAEDASIALTIEGEPVMVTNAGALCGLAFDSAASSLWVLPCSGANLLELSAAGEVLSTVARPGESADDGDVDVPSQNFAFGEVERSAGTLLFTNGETGTADIYAIGPDRAASEPLVTAFGASHTVGGSLHGSRQSFFAVQDRVPGGSVGNVLAELDLADGTVLASFSTLPHFDVNYGDVDVCQSTGHLLVVSSNEASLAEFDPDGSFIGAYPLPSGVTLLSGIGVDDATGTAWVASTTGRIWHLSGVPCGPSAP